MYDVAERCKVAARRARLSEKTNIPESGVRKRSSRCPLRVFSPLPAGVRLSVPMPQRHLLTMPGPFRIRFFRRIQELMREIGTLLIAFAPLDVALQGSTGSRRVLVFFLG